MHLTKARRNEKYAKKYFRSHLTEDKIQTAILDDAPVPKNSFLEPPQVDEYIGDIISDQKSLKFLRMNDNALKFVQKRLGQCMGPLSKIWEEVDDLEKDQSNMKIDELKELVEKTILMIGQTNVACLFERRLNFLAKLMHSAKKMRVRLSKKTKNASMARKNCLEQSSTQSWIGK